MAVLSFWEHLGSGDLNPGDALLPAGIKASLRAAREALLDVPRPAAGRVSSRRATADGFLPSLRISV
jgi:hypothetical protein